MRNVNRGFRTAGRSFFVACVCTLPLTLIAPLIMPVNGTAATPATTESSNAIHTPSVASSAATPTPSARTGSKTKTPTTQGPAITRDSVISFLNAAISWYRHLDVEQTLATQPAEMLYFADDRVMAHQAVTLAFDFARAATPLVQATARPVKSAAQGAGTPTAVNGLPISVVPALASNLAQAQAEVKEVQSRIADLQSQLRTASGRSRQTLTGQIAAAQSQYKLAELRLESLQTLANFEKGTGAAGRTSAGGLQGEIDELEQSIPLILRPENAPQTSAARPTVPAQTEPITASGIIGHAENLLSLARKQQTLRSTINLTDSLNTSVKELREPLAAAVRQIDTEANNLALQLYNPNPAALEQSKAQLDQLINSYKLNVNALMPLIRMSGVLEMYSANLERWRNMVGRQSAADLRALAVGLGGLAIVLGVIAFCAIVWRRLVFRYVHERQHRQQLLQLRRVVITFIVALVLVFDFANQFSALATILGFAAAGIALALQNVIMSMAGYLYVSGRYGIRVGDRVQISGINGDVLEIGLFKLTMLELSGDANGQQPTGRAVIFPNSVVFQTTGNFFRQVPGTNFTWNELKISLAPDCDYGLIEKRLLDIVGQVYNRYRPSIEHEYQNMEKNLSIRADRPKPMCRLQFSEAAIELIVRYPVRIDSTAETQDEVARRVVDTLRKDPSLRLKVQGTPNVEPAPSPQSQPDSSAPDGAAE
jgi:small-conductance mechanosensitive channel